MKDVKLDNTNDAINWGIISSVRGGIVDSLATSINKINELNSNSLNKINIVFTGGYAEQIFNLCKKEIKNNHITKRYIKTIQYRYYLVLKGIERLYYNLIEN
jgi:pantothenate kinase type III